MLVCASRCGVISCFSLCICLVGGLACSQVDDIANGSDQVVFTAVSRGTPGGNYCDGYASFAKNGDIFYSDYCGRSFNVAIVDPTTGSIVNEGVQFDTWATCGSGNDDMLAMISLIQGIKNGQMMLIAIGDDAGFCNQSVDDDAIALLESLGSTMIRSYGFRDSWAMIAVKGNGTALAEGHDRDSSVTIETTLSIPH